MGYHLPISLCSFPLFPFTSCFTLIVAPFCVWKENGVGRGELGEGRREIHKRKRRGKENRHTPQPLCPRHCPCGRTHPLLPQCRKANQPCPQPSNRNRGRRGQRGRSSRLLQKGVPEHAMEHLSKPFSPARSEGGQGSPEKPGQERQSGKILSQKRKDKQRHPVRKGQRPPLSNVAACALGARRSEPSLYVSRTSFE